MHCWQMRAQIKIINLFLEIGRGLTCFFFWEMQNTTSVWESQYWGRGSLYSPFCNKARAYPLVPAYEKIAISDRQKRVIIIMISQSPKTKMMFTAWLQLIVVYDEPFRFDRFDSTKSINTTIGIKIFQYVSFRIWIGRVDQTWRISASYLFTLSSLFGMNGLCQSWNDPASRVISPGACRLEDISSPPLVCPNLFEIEGVLRRPAAAVIIGLFTLRCAFIIWCAAFCFFSETTLQCHFGSPF